MHLDLSEVSFLDSSGLRVILALARSRGDNGSVVLLDPSAAHANPRDHGDRRASGDRDTASERRAGGRLSNQGLIVYVRSSPDHPLGDAIDTFIRREDAKRFVSAWRSRNVSQRVVLSRIFIPNPIANVAMFASVAALRGLLPVEPYLRE